MFAGNSSDISCKCRRSCRGVLTHPLTLIMLLIIVFMGVFLSTFFFQREMAEMDNIKHELSEESLTHRHFLKL